MPEQRNLILAIVLSVTIILAFQYFYELPRMKESQHQPAQRTEQTAPAPTTGPAGGQAGAPAGPAAVTPGVEAVPAGQTRAAVLASSPRLTVQGDRVHGSLPLTGGRIDDVILSDYRVTTAPDSPDVILLNPPGAPDTYFAEFGWVAADKSTAVPDPKTVWQTEGGELRTGHPVAFSWDNGQGLRFHRQVAVDDAFMFTVSQRVENTGKEPVTLLPYGLISRWSVPQTRHFYILHEGPIGVLGGKLHEIEYKDLVKSDVQLPSQGGWLGITDKYWLVALVPDQASDLTATFRHVKADDQDHFQVDYLRPGLTVAPGQSIEITERLFAGAKEVDLLDRYGAAYGIPLFDRAVDFGWFYFLTKPLFHVLHFFYGVVGNYGVAILLLTLLVKLLFFPLANKSYTSMSKMKKLQPEMMRLRELYGDDKARLEPGADEPVQDAEGQPDVGLPADHRADPGVLLAVQGAVRVDRDAARAVLRLDPRPVGARPDHGVQPVRADPLDAAGDADDRGLAADHGRDHAPAAEAEPAAGRPDAGQGDDVPAGHVHLPVRDLPGRAGDLLDLEQHRSRSRSNG